MAPGRDSRLVFLERFFEGVANRQRLRLAAASVVVAGAAWAFLCLVLARGGHAPTVTLLPIPAERYYLWQAALVVPVLLTQWLATAAITWRLARAWGGTVSFVALASALGPALAGPLVVVLVVPDFVVHAAFGFEALGSLLRVTGPLLLVVTIGLAMVATRVAAGLSTGRALQAATLGVLLPAAASSVILR